MGSRVPSDVTKLWWRCCRHCACAHARYHANLVSAHTHSLRANADLFVNSVSKSVCGTVHNRGRGRESESERAEHGVQERGRGASRYEYRLSSLLRTLLSSVVSFRLLPPSSPAGRAPGVFSGGRRVSLMLMRASSLGRDSAHRSVEVEIRKKKKKGSEHCAACSALIGAQVWLHCLLEMHRYERSIPHSHNSCFWKTINGS